MEKEVDVKQSFGFHYPLSCLLIFSFTELTLAGEERYLLLKNSPYTSIEL